MKKREITNNDLEQMFNNIIEQNPLVSEEQINSLLNNLPRTNSGSAGKSFFQHYLNTFLLGSVVALLVVSALIWINSDHQSKETIIKNNAMENLVAPFPTDTILLKPGNNINEETGQNTVNENTFLKESAIKASSAVIQTDTIDSLSDIYRHFDKKPQIFSIQANRDTTIVCKEGTSIKINANSFVAEKTGSEISGNVLLAVKEYYKMSDIILSNLTTTSGDKILETGGMIHISATADNKNCIIKPGNNIEIGFPYSNKKEDMDLFYGEWENNRIDWKLANKAKVDAIEEDANVFFIVEEMPEFPGGDLALRRYISDNLNYPVDAAENGITGKVYVTFLINKDGNVSNASIARGVHPSLDKEALRVVNSMPKWKPGKQRGKPVSVSYTIPVIFVQGDLTLTKEEFEKKVKDDNFKNTTVSEVDRYLFGVTQLGWINCDRFYRNNVTNINYSISIEEPEKTIVSLIFHRFKIILPGTIESNRITFKSVPLGEKVTIVALKTIEGKIFLAVKETEISEKMETELDFQQVTLDLLKKEMEKIQDHSR
jgi:TonB family protein